MTKASPEFFRQYLGVLEETISYVEASRAMRLNQGTIFMWINRSKREAKDGIEGTAFFFERENGDGEPRWLHEHVRAAVSVTVESIEAAARSRALYGVQVPAMYQGHATYRLNPDYEDEGLRELLGLTENDKYLRDPVTGERVPEMVWQPPSTDLVLGILAAHTNRYKKQSKVDIDMRASVTGGVLIANSTPTPPAPPQVPPPPVPLPVLEVLGESIEDANFSEETSKDVTDTPPIEDEDFSTPPVLPPKPEVVIRGPAPPQYQPSASGARSALVDDLLKRLRGDPSERSANPVGSTAPIKPMSSSHD